MTVYVVISLPASVTNRIGQNRTCTPYMTVYVVISLPKIPYIHRINIWFWLTLITNLI